MHISPTSIITALTVVLGSIGSHASTTCNVKYANGGDDSSNIVSAFNSCASGGNVVFTAGTTYNLNKAISVSGLTNVNVYVNGNIQYPYPMSGSDKWFMIKGTNVKIYGSSNANSGILIGQGQKFWNAKKTGNPKMLGISLVGGGIYGLKLKNAPSQFISISSCSNVVLDKVQITAISSNPTKYPAKNTDGFDVSHSTNVAITNPYVINGDDCLAINGGVTNLTFSNGYCEGSHGVSVGSLGKDPSVEDDVSNIYISNVHMKGSSYGARFKSWPGGKGTATNLNWSNIWCDGCDMPIYLTEQYCDNEVGCKSGNTSIKIDGISFSNFNGTTSGNDKNYIAQILCIAGTPCEGVKLSNINVSVPSKYGKAVVQADNIPKGENIGVTYVA